MRGPPIIDAEYTVVDSWTDPPPKPRRQKKPRPPKGSWPSAWLALWETAQAFAIIYAVLAALQYLSDWIGRIA